VHYLFPQLADETRQLLVSVMKVRNAIGVQLSGLRQWRTASQREEHQAVTQGLKIEFLQLQNTIRARVTALDLDAVQRIILDQEFLSIPLDKEESTTLSFEKRPCRGRATAGSASSADSVSWTPMQPPRAVEGSVAAPARAKKILVIDDDPAWSQDLARCLGQAGYEIVFATEASKGYDLAVETQPDLIVVDLGLSGKGSVYSGSEGMRILQRLPRSPATAKAVAIAVSAPETVFVKRWALASGALAHFIKPVAPERLLTAVQIALDDVPDVESEEDVGSEATRMN